jgi:hypothetical protein
VEQPGDLPARAGGAAAYAGPFALDVLTERDCGTPVGPYSAMVADDAHGA